MQISRKGKREGEESGESVGERVDEGGGEKVEIKQTIPNQTNAICCIQGPAVANLSHCNGCFSFYGNMVICSLSQ